MKKIIVSLIVLVTVSVIVFFSYEKIVDAWFFPRGHEPFKLPQEFSFQVSEMDSLYITTLKKENAQFYVFFSKDSLVSPSKNQDYVKFETADMSDIVIVFNPNKKNDIYIANSDYLDSVNVVSYNLQVLERKEFDSLFYEPQVKTAPRILKYPYIQYHIITMSHSIFENKHSYGETKEEVTELVMHEALVHGNDVEKNINGTQRTTTNQDHKALRDKDMKHPGYRKYDAARKQLEQISEKYKQVFKEAEDFYKKNYDRE